MTAPRDRADAAFAAAMDAFAPFEPEPRLAVACSGGPDSLALLRLAGRWAADRGGDACALIVDHGLRLESADEAARASSLAAACGSSARVLQWTPPPGAGQAAARVARYALLGDACARDGRLHLLTAHHAEDQAETAAMRLARGGAPFAAAAIEAAAATPWGRVLRPVLGWPRARLRSALGDLETIADPSNRMPRFERVRVRAAADDLAAAGLDRAALIAVVTGAAARRRDAERALTRFAAYAVRPHPAGFLRIARAALAAAPDGLGAQLLARALQAVAGAGHPPRPPAALALLRRLRSPDWRGGSLHGALLAADGGAIVVAREPAAVDPPFAVAAGAVWDGRWRCAGALDAPRRVGAVGAAGISDLIDAAPDAAALRAALPPVARPSLPAIWDGEGLRSVPALGWTRPRAVSDVVLTLAPPRPFATIWTAAPAGSLLGRDCAAHYVC